MSQANGTHGDAPPTGFEKFPDRIPAITHVGQYYYRRDPNGRLLIGFRAHPYHLNSAGSLHGGLLMTLGDFALCTLAMDRGAEGTGQRDQGVVTLSFNAEFIASSQLGDWVEAGVEIIRRTGRLVFARGEITVGEKVLLTFSGLVRRVGVAGD